ncbi:MAG: mu-protocadherin- cell-suface protein, partial [Planctomycetota bacterium]
NFHNQETDEVTPVVGSVNKENQRVALKLQGNDKLLVETGLYNLTNDECPVLVHYSPEEQEQLTLIRLHQPSEDTGAKVDQAPEAGGDKN